MTQDIYVRLCLSYGLWDLISEPEKVYGGLLHKTYKLTTESWVYAVKMLNPEIMKRPEAYGNFIESERISVLNSITWVSLVSAILCGWLPLTQIDEQFVMVFPWVEGKALTTASAWSEACYKIGQILSRIHANGKQSTQAKSYDNMSVNQDLLAHLEEKFLWISVIILDLLEKYNASIAVLNQDLVYSHSDIDQKNVLWDSDGNPVIIDWEAASLVNPYVEALTAALNWSWIVDGVLDKDSFQSLLRWYIASEKENYQLCKVEYLYGCVGFIGWLMYNVSRLWSSNLHDVQLANTEIEKTVRLIRVFHERFDEIREWIHQL